MKTKIISMENLFARLSFPIRNLRVDMHLFFLFFFFFRETGFRAGTIGKKQLQQPQQQGDVTSIILISSNKTLIDVRWLIAVYDYKFLAWVRVWARVLSSTSSTLSSSFLIPTIQSSIVIDIKKHMTVDFVLRFTTEKTHSNQPNDQLRL